jgi:hypothetical protein
LLWLVVGVAGDTRAVPPDRTWVGRLADLPELEMATEVAPVDHWASVGWWAAVAIESAGFAAERAASMPTIGDAGE